MILHHSLYKTLTDRLKLLTFASRLRSLPKYKFHLRARNAKFTCLMDIFSFENVYTIKLVITKPYIYIYMCARMSFGKIFATYSPRERVVASVLRAYVEKSSRTLRNNRDGVGSGAAAVLRRHGTAVISLRALLSLTKSGFKFPMGISRNLALISATSYRRVSRDAVTFARNAASTDLRICYGFN